jgi:hypothetical protein
MESSEERRNPESSEGQAENDPAPVPEDQIDPFPESNPMTPEGYIEGIGNFAQGLKRMLQRWRHKQE